MNNKDIFNKSIFDLPHTRSSMSFFSALSEKIEDFQHTIKSFDGELKKLLAKNLSIIEEQCNAILDVVDIYQKGHPYLAYVKLKSILDMLKELGFLPIQESNVNDGLDEFYRIRVGQKKIIKKDLFHIPFDLREKVSTQRYSISGLPCLYLGDSIYVCWEEMGRPDINQISAARFDLNQSNFKFLFFNHTAQDYRKICFQKNPNGIEALLPGLIGFLTFFPLLLSCSFQVSKPDEVFKPEYIISQLLLQWIVGEQDLDGIKYRSNRLEARRDLLGTFTNIAIPVKSALEYGYCSELSKQILFTEPISWQSIDIMNDRKKLKLSIEEIVRSTRRAKKIELIPGQSIDYFDTKFGKFEEKLRLLHTSSL